MTSPAIRRASRENGTRHLRERLPEEMLAEIGPAPDDPLEVDSWYRRAIAIVQLGVFRGKPWTTMLRDLNKSAHTSSRLVNAELQAEIVRFKRREIEAREGGASLQAKDTNADQRSNGVRSAQG